MLRKILGLALLIGVLGVLLAAPAAAAPQRVGQVEKNGVLYDVYEERKPGDPNLYRYYVEEGALPGTGGGGLSFRPRQNGMESAAFIAATVLFLASVFTVYRRNNLLNLLRA